jgi:ribosomal protein L16 Arg81 hydroxylase
MELPLDNQIYLIDQEKLAEPSQSYVLQPSNVLYIPRGFIHGAYTENNYSLHLTIGIRPLLGIDYLESMLEVLSKENPDLRKSLINDYEDTASVRIGTLLETFFEESKNPYHRKLTREKINAKLASSAKVLPGQLFETSHQFESLALETKVRKANTSNDALVEENGRVRLIFPGSGFAMANNPRPGYIEFPMTAYGALIFIMEQEADFCAGELSGFYPDDSKLLIVSELLKAGYLVFPDQL